MRGTPITSSQPAEGCNGLASLSRHVATIYRYLAGRIDQQVVTGLPCHCFGEKQSGAVDRRILEICPVVVWLGPKPWQWHPRGSG